MGGEVQNHTNKHADPVQSITLCFGRVTTQERERELADIYFVWMDIEKEIKIYISAKVPFAVCPNLETQRENLLLKREWTESKVTLQAWILIQKKKFVI